jgi:hypothetical protein
MNPEDYFLHLEAKDLDPWAGMPLPVTAEQWTNDVLNALTRIEMNPVGRLLLREFQRYRLWIRIKPNWWPSPDAAKRPFCNADTQGLEQVTAGRRFGALVRVSLERFADGTACAKRSAKQGDAVALPHETLFHELVHALRASTEVQIVKRLGGGLESFVWAEEFIAVMVTNIYASCGGKRVLRRDWKGHHRLGEAFDDSFEYFRLGSMTYPIVAEFYATNKIFCLLLANVNARFNPIRAFVESPERARRIAEGATAKRRDGTLTPAQLMHPP